MAATDEDGYNVLTNNPLIVCDASFFTQVLFEKINLDHQWLMRNNIFCTQLCVPGSNSMSKVKLKVIFVILLKWYNPQLNNFNNFGVLPL